jgi:A/G-specific adenine glycosylase
MELGATVCKPVNPDCSSCPISGICQAYAAWQRYLEGGGDPEAADAPRVTQYPGKVSV